MTIRQSKALLISKLKERQLDAPAYTAGALLQHVLKCSAAHLYTHDDQVLTSLQEAALVEGMERLLANEPLDYIIGQRGFMGLEFFVGPGVLVPRADTETLVELCLTHAEGMPDKKAPLDMLDLCTGSGCIAISLTKLLQEQGIVCQTVGVDFSEQALGYARKNGDCYQLNGQSASTVQWILGDVLNFTTLSTALDKTFDIITINPPYIPSGDIVELEAKVREYEPLSALDGGEDGLLFYREMAQNVHRLLKPGGYFACEIGFDQGADVADLFAAEGRYTEITVHKDYAGKDRVVTCRFPST